MFNRSKLTPQQKEPIKQRYETKLKLPNVYFLDLKEMLEWACLNDEIDLARRAFHAAWPKDKIHTILINKTIMNTRNVDFAMEILRFANENGFADVVGCTTMIQKLNMIIPTPQEKAKFLAYAYEAFNLLPDVQKNDRCHAAMKRTIEVLAVPEAKLNVSPSAKPLVDLVDLDKLITQLEAESSEEEDDNELQGVLTSIAAPVPAPKDFLRYLSEATASSSADAMFANRTPTSQPLPSANSNNRRDSNIKTFR